MKVFMKFLVLSIVFWNVAHAKVTDNQKYQLNAQMGGVANQVQLGTLLDGSESLNGSTLTYQQADGHVTKRLLRATYDVSVGSNGSSTVQGGVHVQDDDLPEDALITRSWLHVVTAFSTGNGGVGNLKLQCGTASDPNILANTDMTLHAAGSTISGISSGTVADMRKISSQCSMRGIVSGGSGFTAGKANAFIEYVLPD